MGRSRFALLLALAAVTAACGASGPEPAKAPASRITERETRPERRLAPPPLIAPPPAYGNKIVMAQAETTRASN